MTPGADQREEANRGGVGPGELEESQWEPVRRLPIGCGLAIAGVISTLLWIVVIVVASYLISGRS